MANSYTYSTFVRKYLRMIATFVASLVIGYNVRCTVQRTVPVHVHVQRTFESTTFTTFYPRAYDIFISVRVRERIVRSAVCSLLDHMFYPDGLELSLFVIRSTHVYVYTYITRTVQGHS